MLALQAHFEAEPSKAWLAANGATTRSMFIGVCAMWRGVILFAMHSPRFANAMQKQIDAIGCGLPLRNFARDDDRDSYRSAHPCVIL